MRKLAIIGVFVIASAACGSAQEPLSTSQPQSTTTTAQEIPLESLPSPTADLIRVAQLARDALAAELEVAATDIRVVAIEAGSWTDGSIGCPEPGMSYTQALVDGTRVTLSHDGTTYFYHQGVGGDLFRCEQPAPNGFLVSKTGDLELVPPPGYDE